MFPSHDQAGDDYCLVIIKIFNTARTFNFDKYIKALKYISTIDVQVANLSFTGKDFLQEEYDALKLLSNKGIKLIIASGNDALNLDKKCNTYPACYKNLNSIVVGSDNKLVSNYGSIVNKYERHCIFNSCGTSMSTAIVTGKYVAGLNARCN